MLPKKNIKMNVEQLIKILEQYPKDLPVTICDISDDGDGDGYAPLRDIIEVSSEMGELLYRNSLFKY